MELVDVPDSKSGVGNYVSVRPRPSANKDSLLREAIFIIRWAMGRNDFLSVRRERAEAGELLLNVRKNMMQNSELPFNASEQDNPDHRQIKIASFGRLFLLSDGRWGETTFCRFGASERSRRAFAECHFSCINNGIYSNLLQLNINIRFTKYRPLILLFLFKKFDNIS